MSSLINSDAQLAYRFREARDIPWHGFGTKVTEELSDEGWLAASGLLFKVGLAVPSIVLKDGTVVHPETDGHRLIVKCEKGQTPFVFGTAKRGYEVYQNSDAIETIRGFAQDSGVPIETLGWFGHGERCWALGRIGDDYLLAGNPQEAIRQYLLVDWGHDGNHGVNVRNVTTRVVCQNTLDAALSERGQRLSASFKHTASLPDRIAALQRDFALISKARAKQLERLEQFAQANATDELASQVLDVLAPPAPADAKFEDAKAAADLRNFAVKVRELSPTTKLAGDTRYGLYNWATEYIDHLEVRRGQNRDSANGDWLQRRALYSLEGAGAERRQRVFDLLSVGL